LFLCKQIWTLAPVVTLMQFNSTTDSLQRAEDMIEILVDMWKIRTFVQDGLMEIEQRADWSTLLKNKFEEISAGSFTLKGTFSQIWGMYQTGGTGFHSQDTGVEAEGDVNWGLVASVSQELVM
jgi:hypothetical protein